jgi:DNA-directed RNA polymerase specialized sigma24 family protein
MPKIAPYAIPPVEAGVGGRDAVILSLQTRVHALACRYFYRHPPSTAMETLADLVQSANVSMLQAYPQTLTHPDPIGYLIQTAKHAMFDCLSGRGDAIKVHAYQERITLLSLDVPCTENGDTWADLIPDESLNPAHLEARQRKEASVWRAVEKLPERQQDVIKRHYGLDGYCPEPLDAISRSHVKRSPHSRPHNAGYHKRRALFALRASLAPAFPQFASTGEEAAS